MFNASRLEVLQISLAPTITLPALVMAEKLIVPSFATTLPSVATFACTRPKSMSIASSSTSVFVDAPDSQKLMFLMIVRMSAGDAVGGRWTTNLRRLAGSFL